MTFSPLLINEPPLQLIPSLAALIGLNEAIVLQQVHYWISDKRNRNMFEGRNWVYNTYDQWREQFPFWSKITLIRVIKSLEEKNILLTRQGNITLENRLKYYSIDYEALNHYLWKTNQGKEGDTEGGSDQNDQTSTQNDQTSTQNDQTYIYNERARVSETTQRLHRELGANSSNCPPHSSNAPTLFNFSDQVNSVKPKKRSVRQGTYLPEDWELPKEWREWSLQAGIFNEEIDMIQLKFRNHWLTTHKNPIKKDWFKTWQNWCINEYERKGKILKIKSTGEKRNEQAVKPLSPIAAVKEQSIARLRSSNPQIQAWYDQQSKLADRVGKDNYNSWLADLEFVGIRDSKDRRGYPFKEPIFKAKSQFIADWISVRYLEDLFLILKEIDPEVLTRLDIKIISEPTDGS